MSVSSLSSEALLLLSAILSIGLGFIAYKISNRKWAKQEHLLVWYTVIAGIALLTAFVVCGTGETGDTDFLACAGEIAPWFLLIAAHALMLALFIDRNKRSLLASLLSTALVLAAVYISLLEEFELLVLPTIAIVTIPLITILYKCDQKEDSDKQITCCDCCQ